ncbi:hypothetical protein [Listeria fleischmannii]|nr:hypothetical protein [Listeria fleischmannii]
MRNKFNHFFFEGDEDTEFSTSDKVFGAMLGIVVIGALALCATVGILNL